MSFYFKTVALILFVEPIVPMTWCNLCKANLEKCCIHVAFEWSENWKKNKSSNATWMLGQESYTYFTLT